MGLTSGTEASRRPLESLDRETRGLERFLFLSQKLRAGGAKSKKQKSALKEINHMIKYSNNMENNIKHLNIRSVLEQEFAEKSLKVEGFSELDGEVSLRFEKLLAKRDADFFSRAGARAQKGRRPDK